MTIIRRPRDHRSGDISEISGGILDERILFLVFQSINWDPRVVSRAACVSRKLHAVARRILWRHLCLSRAPRMVSSLASGGGRLAGAAGGWQSLAKLLFFCSGPGRSGSGHFAHSTRFSKTSGRSFLVRKCWGDVLFVSDPCEHGSALAEDDDVGVYRGIFGRFAKSKTRACLIGRQVGLDPKARCPYCGAQVWSMSAAGLVPRSAARWLGTHRGKLEYFVCLNGHLHGTCSLVSLSSDEDEDI